MPNSPAPGSSERQPTWAGAAGVETTSETIDRGYPLGSLLPQRLFEVLDLTRPELAAVRQAVEAGHQEVARAALLEHYRGRLAAPERGAVDDDTVERAAKIARHVFQWGPYEEADYGEQVDWDWDPRGDIEWVAAMHRFYWAPPLAAAWTATGDDRYARAFVDLCSDWIRRHPLQDHRRSHPVYTQWQGFVWLDLQTGIRAYNLCAVFRSLVHSPAFTPDFLALLLASLYDHQVKTEHIPMGVVHNKAIFEQRGAVEVAADFPEFRDARRWLELSRRRTTESLLAQTTTDGVQREWSFGYHMGVLRDAVVIQERLEAAGLPVSAEYARRLQLLHEYCLGVASPFLDTPMFGDGARVVEPPAERRQGALYNFLLKAGERYGDTRYAAVADLQPEGRPEPASRAFPEAGIYALRSGWEPRDIYLALHCSPLAISAHDQPDNGTFELAAFGRWLMPDTGYFTYGHDPETRAWHRQTAVHQTLTLDGSDSAEQGRHVLWHTDESGDALVVENDAYEGLVHRRTVWFAGHGFFLLLDEAIGQVEGELDLHFQLGPGAARIDDQLLRATTSFSDANVLVAAAQGSRVRLVEEEGWWAWHYGHRQQRPAFCFRHGARAPAAFLTLIVPYAGQTPPEVGTSLPDDVQVNDARLELEVHCAGHNWLVGRDMDQGSAWCRLQ